MLMAGIKILLDTNIISSLMASDAGLAAKIDAVNAVYLPVISLGELYFGAFNSSRIEQYLSAIGTVASFYPIINTNDETGKFYGKIKAELKKKGKPIPENDIWIAAIAIQHKFMLISRDQHFSEIAELLWEIW